MKEVVIFGTGQTSEIVSYYLNKETDFKIVAYIFKLLKLTNPLHYERLSYYTRTRPS